MARTLQTPVKSLRALVLDADAASLRSLTRSLEARCFSVATATDGTTGVAALLDELLSLDVVVVDAALPHRDARGFAHLIRGAGGERDLAIVVVARGAGPELRAELVALGVDAVVDASEGPETVAAAALAAIASRTASRGAALEAEPATEAERALDETARFALPIAARWTLLPV